jgi:hypothetical protein
MDPGFRGETDLAEAVAADCRILRASVVNFLGRFAADRLTAAPVKNT